MDKLTLTITAAQCAALKSALPVLQALQAQIDEQLKQAKPVAGLITLGPATGPAGAAPMSLGA
jgi:hypothetical protein